LLLKQVRAFSSTDLKPSDGGPGGIVQKEQVLQFSKAPI
jgi:processing peptidase subunit beta